MKYIVACLFFLFTVMPVFSATFDIQNVTWTSAVYVTVSGNSMTRTTGADVWNAGAFSTQSLLAGKNGYVESTAQETTTYRMFGFSDSNTDASYTSIDFAIYLATGASLYVYENGSNRGNFGSYTTGDVFRVAREGTVIQYYKNGTVFYTSTQTNSAALYADTSLYTSGATISNVKIATEVVPEPMNMLLLGLGCMFLIFSKRLF